ncbi:MAG TPA: cytochrome P460 family protein [Terracidiphilus sp.]|nr:cytochrome P460 family protein [Terracidiphilus sp.]
MKKSTTLAVAGLGVFALLQLVRPSIPARPAIAEVQAPQAVRSIFEKDCYSCHSDERRLSWFDEIVPAYWLVRHDVLTARRHLNFSTLGSKPAAAQRATLFEAVNMIQLGAMPLPQFVRLHPEAKVTPEELDTLKSYLAPWGPLTPQPTAGQTAHQGHAELTEAQPELNGVAFDPAFEGWSLLSVTDRGDNNTFRFILGNDVAMKALASGNISPWPDGTKFAKIAWQQAQDDGLVRPGNFVQVELMVKDASRYKATEGWGWGRWRGLDLKPYGNDAGFVNECTGCHKPLRGNDYVYTMPLAPTTVPGTEVVNSRAASFGQTPLPLTWRPMTLFVDRKARTISVLFGKNGVLALVTWNERDDPHWFGARIPDQPVSLETMEVAPDGEAGSYRRFNSAGQLEDALPNAFVAQRTAFLLGLAPAQLP